MAKHGIVIPEEECRGVLSETEDNEMDYETEDESLGLEDEGGEVSSLSDWLKDWSKREQISEKVKRIAKR